METLAPSSKKSQPGDAMGLSGMWVWEHPWLGDLWMDPSAGAGSLRHFLAVPDKSVPNSGCATGSLPSPTRLLTLSVSG